MSDTKALMMTSEHENELRADIESGKRLQPIPIGSVLPLLNTIESLRAENARLKDKADTYDFVCKELGTKDHILGVVAVMREKLKAAEKIATLAVKHRRRWPNEWAEEHQRDIDTYTAYIVGGHNPDSSGPQPTDSIAET